MGGVFRTLAVCAFHVVFMRPLLWGLVGIRFRRRSLLPDGPCLVVSNHNSHLDAGALMSLFPIRRLPRVHPVAAADYFGKNWLRRTMAMLFMNGIPIERTPKPGQDTLQPMVEALKAGETLVFFPEGSRGEAGVVGPFRSGIGRLAKQMPGLLVVPVFLSGPERVLPRGQRFILPLGIDVNVGKPRAYSPDADARAIADEVRRAVLSLAPPPLPIPGPRPAPPFRTAICGIEASSRGALFPAVVARLGRADRTVGIGSPAVVADAEGIRELAGGIPVARGRAWIGLLARLLRMGGIFSGYKFAEMVERARLDEGLEDGRSGRFVVSDGHPLVDLLAFTEALGRRGPFDERRLHQAMQYLAGKHRVPFRKWPGALRRAPGIWLVNVLGLARLGKPDVLVLVLTPPPLAMERIRSGAEPPEPYEDEPFLAELQESYRRIASFLRKRGVAVLEVDGSDTHPEEVSALVEETVLRLAPASNGSGARSNGAAAARSRA